MKENWIAWDWQPDYEWFETEQEAKAWCIRALAEEASDARTEGGWPEEMKSFGIGYAKVISRTTQTNQRPVDKDDSNAFDYMCDYELRQVED